MNTNSTHINGVTTNRFSIRRVIILFAICILLPACSGNINNCHRASIGGCLPKSELKVFADATLADANEHIQRVIADGGQYLQEFVAMLALGEQGDAIAVAAPGYMVMNLTNPMAARYGVYYKNLRDTNVEERNITAGLPKLMRMAVMLLLIAVML